MRCGGNYCRRALPPPSPPEGCAIASMACDPAGLRSGAASPALPFRPARAVHLEQIRCSGRTSRMPCMRADQLQRWRIDVATLAVLHRRSIDMGATDAAITAVWRGPVTSDVRVRHSKDTGELLDAWRLHRMRSNGGQAGQRQLIDLGRRIDTGDVMAEALASDTKFTTNSPVARIFVAVSLKRPCPASSPSASVGGSCPAR